MSNKEILVESITTDSTKRYVDGLVQSQWTFYKDNNNGTDESVELRAKDHLQKIDAILDRGLEMGIYKLGDISGDHEVMPYIGSVAFFDSITKDIDHINSHDRKTGKEL